MDSVHDLGGKQGYGAIDVDEPEVPFKHEWEGRMWGISSCSGSSDWTIDWWRHVREAIDPVDYLTRPYFDSWAQTELAAYVTQVSLHWRKRSLGNVNLKLQGTVAHQR